MATKPAVALRVPLPISKSEMPGNALAKAAIAATGVTITRVAKTLKTPIAWTQFWEGLMAYCTRNLAEANGTGTPVATAAGGGKGPGAARTAAGATPTKRPHRATRTAGASA